jgi:uncharacterized protein YutE (UPF0331/DUF86 family)
MVDIDILATKLNELFDFISRIRSVRPGDVESLVENRDAFDLVAYNLVLAVQACLDLASHLIADEEWELATKASESFMVLAQHGVISKDSAEILGKAASLRNVLVHGYSKAVPDRVYAAATAGLGDLERFADEISAWVRNRA